MHWFLVVGRRADAQLFLYGTVPRRLLLAVHELRATLNVTLASICLTQLPIACISPYATVNVSSGAREAAFQAGSRVQIGTFGVPSGMDLGGVGVDLELGRHHLLGPAVTAGTEHTAPPSPFDSALEPRSVFFVTGARGNSLACRPHVVSIASWHARRLLSRGACRRSNRMPLRVPPQRRRE